MYGLLVTYGDNIPNAVTGTDNAAARAAADAGIQRAILDLVASPSAPRETTVGTTISTATDDQSLFDIFRLRRPHSALGYRPPAPLTIAPSPPTLDGAPIVQ